MGRSQFSLEKTPFKRPEVGMRLGKKLAVGEVVDQFQTEESPIARPSGETVTAAAPPAPRPEPVEPVTAQG
jgi:hypothetical protein